VELRQLRHPYYRLGRHLDLQAVHPVQNQELSHQRANALMPRRLSRQTYLRFRRACHYCLLCRGRGGAAAQLVLRLRAVHARQTAESDSAPAPASLVFHRALARFVTNGRPAHYIDDFRNCPRRCSAAKTCAVTPTTVAVADAAAYQPAIQLEFTYQPISLALYARASPSCRVTGSVKVDA